MSRRPRWAATAALRLNDPTRRTILAGLSCGSLATPAPAHVDETVAVGERWLALNAEAERLQSRWGDLEDVLVRHHRWYKLTERERCRLPAGQELFDIDERMDALDDEREATLKRLPTLQAKTRAGLAAKLAVAAIAISPDDHVDEHSLIASILRDLKMMPVGTI